MNKSLKIIFFGSGPVAARSLELLLEGGLFEVEKVITKANPAHHRGSAPVIDLCKQRNLAYVTPANKSDLTAHFQTANYQSRLGVVIDYGIIIEQAVIDYFALGIINSHFSLLPQWRGADPITFSILSGQEETGVSLMSITAGLDEGPLLSQDKLRIQPNETTATLTQKLIQLSNDMLHRDIPTYVDGSLKLNEQTGTPSFSRKLTKADGIVDWTKPAVVLEREIRAFYEWPKSLAQIGSQQVIIRQAVVENTSGPSGNFITTKDSLVVHCGVDSLKILRLQPLNKKEMPVEAFLRGYTL